LDFVKDFQCCAWIGCGKMAIDLRDGVDFMDVLQVIKNRRSIHTFQPQEVPDDILIDIFSYASYAPTHYMKEPWNIKMYQGEGRHKLIDESMASYKRLGMFETGSEVKTEKMIASMKDFLLDIPHHALIYMPIEEDPVRYEEEYAAVCAFIQNAQLAAWIFGVGMLWTITPYMHDAEFVRRIGLCPDEEKVVAVMQIGYPEKVPRNRGRTPIQEKIEFIRK